MEINWSGASSTNRTSRLKSGSAIILSLRIALRGNIRSQEATPRFRQQYVFPWCCHQFEQFCALDDNQELRKLVAKIVSKIENVARLHGNNIGETNNLVNVCAWDGMNRRRDGAL
jgi:hypothetical protein